MSLRILAACLPLAVGACAQAVSLPTAESVSAANVPSSASLTAQTIVGVEYTPRDVTEPANWRDLNDAQSPSGGSE